MKKVISIVLIAAMLLSFAACAKSESNTPSDTTAPVTTAAPKNTIEYEPDSLPPELDFGGETVTILSLVGGTENSFYETMVTVEELSSQAVNDSIYNRELFVEDRLGVEIENVKVGSVTNEMEKVMNAGDDIYDGFIHVNHILSQYVFEYYLQDLNSVKYLDFDKPWWSSNFNEEAEIFDELYLSTGSLCLSLIRNTYGVFYNKNLAKDYAGSLPELENLYALVDAGKWTFDKFTELGGEIYNDINGNSMRDLEDIYGIAYGNLTPIDAIWSGFDLNVLSKTSDGWFEFDVNADKLYTALDKIFNMLYESKGSIVNDVGTDVEGSYGFIEPDVCFSNGTNLFFVEKIGYTDSTSLRNMQDDYGLLPYPKYDESQKEYHSFVNDLFASVAIPITNSNPDLVGAVFEAMASYSYRETMPIYLDIVLKGQYMSDPESRKMVDIIIDGISVDAAWIYLHTLASQYPAQYRYEIYEKERSFASMHQGGKNKVDSVLKAYIRVFK